MGTGIRHEMPGDEAGDDVVNCSAFESMSEACMVQLMGRFHAADDRRYSITVWEGHDMVGHALFSPARFRKTLVSPGFRGGGMPAPPGSAGGIQVLS